EEQDALNMYEITEIGKEQDARFKELFDAATGDSPPPNFIVENGVLWLHHEGTTVVSLYIPDVNHRGIKLRESLLENAHTQHGHNGGQRLYESLKNSIFWEGMRKDCIDYVKQCHSCQISKPSNQKPFGLLHSLPIPNKPWESVGIDFVGPLQESDGFDGIMVTTCRLTGLVDITPCMMDDDAPTIAKRWLDGPYRHYGCPDNFVSDRDTKFLSHFWKEFCKLLDVSLNMTSGYHPQANGKTERANRMAITILRHFVDIRQTNWRTYLAVVQFAINSSISETTKQTPFKLFYGWEPRSISDLPLPTSDTINVPAAGVLFKNFHQDLQDAKAFIAEAQRRQTEQYNKKRRAVNPDTF